MQWQRKKKGREPRVRKRGQEQREGGRKGVFRIVIGAVEVITKLKSSRCGPAPEKELQKHRNQEGGRSMYRTVPFHMIRSLPSSS